MKSRIAVLCCVLLSLVPVSLCAQDVWKEGNGKEITGLRAMMLNHYNDASKKVIDLASAMPEEKYTWRPMEGVRSVSEVYMHIAGSNYSLPSLIGYKRPDDIKRDDETTIYPFGERARGSIIYTESGRYSAQLMRRDRPRFAEASGKSAQREVAGQGRRAPGDPHLDAGQLLVGQLPRVIARRLLDHQLACHGPPPWMMAVSGPG